MLTNNRKISQSSKIIFRVLRQQAYTKLFKKYTSGDFSYNKILANNLVFNDSCRIVARFKDYLILDDNTEFIRRFYFKDESHPRLNRILNFYETYSKIFPNYMILKESKYLYRNIRKKQKMIDAVNEIKREEEENRKRIKLNNNKNNDDKNELFTKKVKEEIKTFQENNTFRQENNNFDSDNDDANENSISISILNRKMFENIESKFDKIQDNGSDRYNSILESFVTNETNHSISGILNVLNDNKIYIQDLPKIFEINTYSKNSQKIKKSIKKPNKSQKEIDIPDKKTINNKPAKVYNKCYNQYQLDKKTYTNPSNILNNINNNYITTKGEIKKISMLSTSPGTILASNTEKNNNEINQYQNIIIPKGNTVININNNYFDQTPSLALQMGYYTNKNFKINKNSKINSNNNCKNNSIFKKNNTNNNNKKTNNLQKSEKKINNTQKFVKNLINDEKNISQKNLNYVYKTNHNKQISQEYIYHKINNNEIGCIKEKIIKFNSLSPTPIPSKVESKIQKTKNNNYLQTEKNIYHNYLTENTNPNLIKGNMKTNEDINDNEKEKLILCIRDAIENKKKDNIDKDEMKRNILFSGKKNKIKSKIIDDEKKFNQSNFIKNKTLTNFKYESKDFSNILKKENNNLEEKCLSIKNIHHQTEKISKEKKDKAEKKNKYKRLQIKPKKNKSKGIMKNNKLNSDKKEIFLKTNYDLKSHKNLYDNFKKENSLMSSIEKHPKKNNKISQNNPILKTEKAEKNNVSEKGNLSQFQNILNKSNTISKLSKLLMSHKKENQCFSKNNNGSMKIYHKSKISNMKYKKDNLILDNQLNQYNTNSICYTNMNNFSTDNNNTNNKIILTENSIINKNLNSNEINNKFSNSELRNKYKNFLLKKNKIKSCEFENQTVIQSKPNKELIDRMTLVRQNNISNFYLNNPDNTLSLGIKSYRANNIGSFDYTNFNPMKAINPKECNNNNITEKNVFKTPSMENKKIGLYKKVINRKMKLVKTEQKLDDRYKNYMSNGTIKVNRAKFMENAKNKIYDNHSKSKLKK